MFKKIHFCSIGLASIVLSIFGSTSIAQTPNQKSTMWGVVDKSLTELLDSGWKITSQSSYRIVINSRTLAGAAEINEETTHVYTLYKNGKNISCFIANPRPNEASSRCRQLN